MRLTVGPLPAAVYWRRRALVLSVLAFLIVLTSYACGGASSSTAGGAGTGAQATEVAEAATASTTDSTDSATDSTTGTAPEVDGPVALTESAQPEGSAFALATTDPTGFCADAEMKVSATASSGTSAAGAPLELTLKIKNVGSRTCRRDIGADVQEFRISRGKSLVWSSDDCTPNHGHNVRIFMANQEAVFWVRWSGSASRGGKGEVSCGSAAPLPAAGDYQLTGRLDGLISEVFPLRIT